MPDYLHSNPTPRFHAASESLHFNSLHSIPVPSTLLSLINSFVLSNHKQHKAVLLFIRALLNMAGVLKRIGVQIARCIWGPILIALTLDILYPELPFCNFLITFIWSWRAYEHAVYWLFAGYVDIVSSDGVSLTSFKHVCGSWALLVARRFFVLCYFRATSVFLFVTWNRATVLVALCLCLAAWCGLSILDDFALVIIQITCRSISKVIRAASRVIRAVSYFWSPPSVPTSAFSYLTMPDFDPSTQIRLLKLDKRLPFSQVMGEVISYNLENVPAYHAISYAWSHGPQDLQEIKLNDMSLSVKRNVYDILLRCSSFFEPQFIWIDSICIDQTSSAEKTVQVRRMQEIYERATTVLVCLGSGPAYSVLILLAAIGLLQQYSDPAREIHYVPMFLRSQKTNPIVRPVVKALLELQQHGWFERAWCVTSVPSGLEHCRNTLTMFTTQGRSRSDCCAASSDMLRATSYTISSVP